MNGYLQQVIDLDWQAGPAELSFNQQLHELIEQDILPRTMSLFQGLLGGMCDLRYTLYECARRGDMAGGRVISQALIEQYVRFQYLLVRQFNHTDDMIGQRYSDAQLIQTVMAVWRAEHATRREHNKPLFTLDLIWDQMQEEHPQLAVYSLKQAQELLEEFAWPAITDYLEAAKVHGERDMTTALILEHARNECWVQGGLLRDGAIRLCQDEAQQITTLNRLCSLALKLTLSAKTFCCYLGERYEIHFTAIVDRLWPMVLALEKLEAVTALVEQ